MKTRRLDRKKTKALRIVERQHEQFFSPFPRVLLSPEGSLAQPSPYLNIWGVQASNSGEEPTIEDSLSDEGESHAKLG